MRSNCFPSFFYQNSGSRLGREPFSPKEAPRFEGLLRGGQPEPPAGRSARRKLGARRRPLTWRALGCGRAGKCAARGHVAGKRQTGSEPRCLGPLLPRGAGVPSHPWTPRPASGTRRVGGPGARSAPASCGLTSWHPVHAPQAGPRPSAPLAPQIRYGGCGGWGGRTQLGTTQPPSQRSPGRLCSPDHRPLAQNTATHGRRRPYAGSSGDWCLESSAADLCSSDDSATKCLTEPFPP